MVLDELKRYREMDFTFASGRILGSMCTEPLPIAKKAYRYFLETNLGDPDLFPGSKKVESLYLSFVLDLLNAPENAGGIVSSGGTESNITAVWLAKRLSGKKKVIISEGGHFSFQKIASLMDVELVVVPLDREGYYIDTSMVRRRIDDDVAMVLGVAGSTELGVVDPIRELSDICSDENVFLHVDAAFGGYVIPFLRELGYSIDDFDFKLRGISSISIDAHKMGCSAIPMGTLVVREKKWLDEISVESHCVSGKKQAGLLGTRSGGPVAAAYAVTRYLGRDGYKRIVKKCMNNTLYLLKKIRGIGLNVVVEPSMNVLGVKLKKPLRVAEKLTRYGWKVNIIDRVSAVRVVVMPHVTKKVIDEFIPVLEKVCREEGEI
ncbi:MAG: tyrosine decarboxylase MfnA [Thermoplasmata archaeon]|nr:MAG: tyrosine decarboxylase MfnA [Thermoplasmata archaeon]